MVGKEGKGAKITALVLGIIGNLSFGFLCFFILLVIGFGLAFGGYHLSNSVIGNILNLSFYTLLPLIVISGLILSITSLWTPKTSGWFLAIEGVLSFLFFLFFLILDSFNLEDCLLLLPPGLLLIAGIIILKKVNVKN